MANRQARREVKNIKQLGQYANHVLFANILAITDRFQFFEQNPDLKNLETDIQLWANSVPFDEKQMTNLLNKVVFIITNRNFWSKTTKGKLNPMEKKTLKLLNECWKTHEADILNSWKGFKYDLGEN